MSRNLPAPQCRRKNVRAKVVPRRSKRTIIFAPSAAESIADMLSPPGAFPAVRGAGITTSSSVSDSSSRGAYSRLRGTHAMRHFKRLHDGCINTISSSSVGTECGAGGWLAVSRTRSTADCCICNRFLAAFSAIIVLSASGVFICKATGVLSWEKPTDHSGERTGAQRHEEKLEHLLASTQRKVRQYAQPRPVLANLSICHSPHTCETSVPARPRKGSI